METWKNLPEISIILPVYNVADYLDACMESIEAQSFPDFEILLINDGSTDGSAEKCRGWAARDSRIRFIDQENRGVSAARNLGVKLARGKYLAFVDPDDWLDPRYLEKLRAPLEKTGSDFAECDLWRFDNRTGKKIYRSCGGQMGVPYTLREHMKYAPTATYKSMSRKSLWEQRQIRMPDCSFESPAIYALVVALSGKVESVPEPLYYYRRFRENSLIETGYAAKDGRPDPALGVEAMRFLLGEFRRCGIYEEYRAALEGVVKYRLSDILATQFHRRSDGEFRLLVGNCRSFLQEAFPEGKNAPYITWGGYNLNRILTHMNWLHDPSCRFNFSSIVSVCGDGAVGVVPPFSHRNRYRQIMLERERRQSFWDVVRETRPEYLFMDLVEERFDLLQAGSRYLTLSDAYDSRVPDAGEAPAPSERIPRQSAACTELWKRSAGEFTRRLKALVPEIRIVLIENYLSETVGDLSGRTAFPGLSEIRGINSLLAEYYAFLEELCPDAVIVRPAAEEPLYFTDRNYEYGAQPAHLNEIVNRKIAARLEALL